MPPLTIKVSVLDTDIFQDFMDVVKIAWDKADEQTRLEMQEKINQINEKAQKRVSGHFINN